MTLREGLQNAIKERKLGTALKEVISAVGIKPCGGCKKRAEFLDEWSQRILARRNIINQKIG